MFQQLLNRLDNLSSAIEVAVVARVAACFDGRGPSHAHPIFDFTAHGAVLLTEFLNSYG